MTSMTGAVVACLSPYTDELCATFLQKDKSNKRSPFYSSVPPLEELPECVCGITKQEWVLSTL